MLYELNITDGADVKVLLKSYMKEHKLSYRQMAAQLNLTKSAIGNIMSDGMNRTPTLEHTVRLLSEVGYELIARKK